MLMDADTLAQTKFWFDVVQTLLIFAFWLHTWLNNRHAVNEKSIRALEEKVHAEMSGFADRLARQEQNYQHAPTREDFIRVHQRLDEVNKEIHKLTGQFEGANKTLSLIHEVMITRNL